jgi:serine/threonine-protein kinase
MGVVYRGTQLALGRRVAVKAIVPDLAEDASFRDRFRRESQLAAAIDHPNVIPVYEAGESDGTLYLIMRWVQGTDLRLMLDSVGRLSPARAVRLLRPVASALGAAHQQGLVHRDVKPANVLIAAGDEDREEHVYLTDFGIARRITSKSVLSGTSTFVGTVDYMAPERILGKKGNSASDIYSFGCMLFEVLTGQVPFERPTQVARVFAHVNDPVPSARATAQAVPESLDGIAMKAMAKRPEDRFATAGELARVLGEALDDRDAGGRAMRAQTVLSGAANEPTEVDGTVLDVASPTERGTAGATDISASTAVGDQPAATAKRRRRTGWLAASAALLVAIAVVLVITLGGNSRRAASSSSPAAGPVSPTGPHVSPSREVTSTSSGLRRLRTVALGGTPDRVSVTQSRDVWVSLPTSGTVARVAPSGSVTRFELGGRPGLIAAGPAGVWVSGTSRGALALVDERTAQPIAAARLSSLPTALAIDPGDGSAWAGDSSGAVVHVDPAGSLSGRPARVPSRVAGLGWGEGWVWAVNGSALARVSLDGSGSTTTFDTHPGPISVAFNQGVWTAHTTGTVTRFDPRPSFLNVNTDASIAPSLDAISASEKQPSVWAISKQTQTLYRISTQTGAPVTGTARFASAPVALAVEGSSVWVATKDGNLAEIG